MRVRGNQYGFGAADQQDTAVAARPNRIAGLEAGRRADRDLLRAWASDHYVARDLADAPGAVLRDSTGRNNGLCQCEQSCGEKNAQGVGHNGPGSILEIAMRDKP